MIVFPGLFPRHHDNVITCSELLKTLRFKRAAVVKASKISIYDEVICIYNSVFFKRKSIGLRKIPVLKRTPWCVAVYVVPGVFKGRS